MGVVKTNVKCVRWVAVVVTLLSCGWVRGITPADTAGVRAICVALLQCILEFPFHQYAVNARDL
eukprot:1627093-Lingulodinium_polyedra.AAC.1